MAKRRVTFEVDTVELFNMLAKQRGDMTELGNRLVSALLVEPGLADLVGMQVYGVSVLPDDDPA
jgi:hypothetical protein